MAVVVHGRVVFGHAAVVGGARRDAAAPLEADKDYAADDHTATDGLRTDDSTC